MAGCAEDIATQQVTSACEQGDTQACGYLMQQRQAQAAVFANMTPPQPMPVAQYRPMAQTHCRPDFVGGMVCTTQ